MLKIRVNKAVGITEDLITNIIAMWDSGKEKERLLKLEKYYKGEHDILDRSVDVDKPNNKLVINYAKLITDNATGYFMGIPVTYESDEKEFINKVFEILDDNSEEDINFELAKTMSKAGRAYELIYADEEANVRFKEIDNKSVIPVYTDDIQERLLFAIRHYTSEDISTGNKTNKAEVYTSDEIIYYESTTNKLTEVSRKEHHFGEVPINEYINNNEMMGDFEVVLSLIDDYNKSQSDTSNDFEYFTDAYLKLVGMDATEWDDVKEMKKNRVIIVPQEGDAGWLIKEVNDAATENYKNRLQNDIHRISQVPDLTDEKFAGNVSGEAMKYKLWGLEQIAAIKERKFKSPLIKRLRLITNFLNKKGANYDYNKINLKFHRNIPKNLIELVEMVQDLGSTVSQKTKLGLLPFIDDVDAEINRIQEDGKRTIGEIYDGATKII